MTRTRDSVAVDNRAGFKLVAGATVGAAGMTPMGDIKKNPRMMIPEGHSGIRTKSG